MAMNSFQSDAITKKIEFSNRITNLRDGLARQLRIEGFAQLNQVQAEDLAGSEEFNHLSRADLTQTKDAMTRIVTAIGAELEVLARVQRP